MTGMGLERIARSAALLGLIALAACSSVGGVAPYQSPQVTPLQASARYVLTPTFTALVVPAYYPGREGELAAIAKAECANRTFCAVGFWTDDTLAPRRVKMTAAEVDARKAQFVFSAATGLSRALWDCRTVNSIAGECL
jgi:hypothetical protein